MVISVFMSCKQETKDAMVDNILLKEWTGPYGGVPAFDLMKVEDVKDAHKVKINFFIAICFGINLFL